MVAVAEARTHAAITEARQPTCRLLGERLDDLDGMDVGGKLREHRRLVSGAGADLEGSPTRFDPEQVGHERDDVGLGNGLSVADGQRTVGVSGRPQVVGNELVPRHPVDSRPSPRGRLRPPLCFRPSAT